MAPRFQREYLVELPLPLAQLYSRAYGSADARARHDTVFSLFESLIKLLTAPALACYRRGEGHAEAVDRGLRALGTPSLGHWVGLLRELARHFGQRPAGAHPLGHLWGQLSLPRRDLHGVLALYRRIKNRVDGERAGDQHCSLLELFEALVPYRNDAAHGAPRPESFYPRDMEPLLLPAVNEVLAEGVLDPLGPAGSRLVHLAELRQRGGNRVDVVLRPLVGLQPGPPETLTLDQRLTADLSPDRVAVLWQGHALPLLPLDPLLVYRARDPGAEVLFFNSCRGKGRVEYLSCLDGRIEPDESAGPALAALLEPAAAALGPAPGQTVEVAVGEAPAPLPLPPDRAAVTPRQLFRIDAVQPREASDHLLIDVGFLRVRLKGVGAPTEPIFCGCASAKVLLRFRGGESAQDPRFVSLPECTEAKVEYGIGKNPIVRFETVRQPHILNGRGRIDFATTRTEDGALGVTVTLDPEWISVYSPATMKPADPSRLDGAGRVLLHAVLQKLLESSLTRKFEF
jgi:hypothetical protein